VTITYHQRIDVLYIRLDEAKQEVINQVFDGVVLDLGSDDRIVGIEILDASKRLRLDNLLPVEFQKSA
jgi:uncharacterized protein YuzE